jgi:hypothetical protein
LATLRPAFVPPAGGDLLWRANEPAGMTLVTDNPFATDNGAATGSAWAAWDNSAVGSPYHSNISDPTAPHSPPNVEQIRWPAGVNVGGGAPTFSEWNIAHFKHIYFCYWIKYSANWDGNVDGINKHGYVWNMPNNPIFVYEAEGSHASSLVTRMALQGVVSQPNSDGWYPQNLVPGATLTRGSWDLIEILLTGNTSGTADGGIDVWLNGVHVSSWNTIQFMTGTSDWFLGRFYPVFGGASSQTLSAEQFLYLDQYYMSGKN